ncbi:glycoside hydrolase family 172 protein [Cohnella sp.]|uniref:glycoside hydrolase family 172 protein n=1 Tax=Cohnella sp. TaxID=1883426 RepID=UPI0037041EE4
MSNDYNGFSLASIAHLPKGRSRSISAENPNGAPGSGGKEASGLGAGRKGRPCLILKPGERVTIAEIDGPGVIQSMWMTFPQKSSKGYYAPSDLVLRMYWDHEETPSVEAPLGDFFCNGFGARYNVNSLPIVVNPVGGMNCYFPMPFRRKAVITVESEHAAELMFFYQINYMLVDELPEDTGYFHAQWRREHDFTPGNDFTIIDNVRGRGKYVGTFLAWTALGRYWWGEGEVKFYMDGDTEYPTICGTGVEDYFGGAWGFTEVENGMRIEQIYNTPYLGYPYYATVDKTMSEYTSPDSVPMHGLYRWHIADPILFEQQLRVTVQKIGNDGLRLYERIDDIASVAYWYQTEPHAPFPTLPSAEARWPR